MKKEAWLVAAFRLLLRLHPPDVRERWGPGMVSMFAERVREKRATRVAWLWLAFREFAGIAADVIRERMVRRAPLRPLSLVRAGAAVADELRERWTELVRAPGSAVAAVVLTTFTIALAGSGLSLWLTRSIALETVPSSERVLVLLGQDRENGWETTHASVADLTAAVRASGVFDSWAAYAAWPVLSWQRGDRAIALETTFAEAAYFDILGASTVVGRLFHDSETRPGSDAAVAVIGHSTWVRWFDADPSVIGRRLILAGREFTVIGVLAPGFFDAHWRTADIWLPLPTGTPLYGAGVYDASVSRQFFGLARVRPGLGAGDGMRALEDASRGRGISSVTGRPLRVGLFGTAGGAVVLLLTGGVVVLALALLDLALLRAMKHEDTLSQWRIRLCLGAGGERIRLGALATTTGIVASGTILGTLLIGVGSDALRTWVLWPETPTTAPSFRAAATVGVLMLACLLPWEHRRIGRLLRSAMPARPGRIGWRFLVGAQCAVAVALTIGAALAGVSLLRLHSVELGYATDGLLTQRLDVSRLEGARISRFAREFPDAAEMLPGVESAGLWAPSMTGDNQWFVTVTAAGEASPRLLAPWIVLSPGALEAAGIAILTGRGITASDDGSAPCVLVIGEALAGKLWPDGDAVGRRIALPSRGVEACRIVGVAAEARPVSRITRNMTAGTAYFALAQWPTPYLSVLVRSHDAAVQDRIGELIGRMLPGTATHDRLWMADRVRSHERFPRFSARASAIIALGSTLLVLLGSHAVLGRVLRRKRIDLAIRQVVGASPLVAFLGVMQNGLPPVVAGAAVGTITAHYGLPLARPFIFGLRYDPTTEAVVAAVFVALATIAIAAVALRAVRANPARILRDG